MVKHPWHEVESGADVPAIVTAVIEIPKGSKAKFEIHKPSGLIMLDRVLFSSVHYPAHYGFIPQTLGDDGDPLDILVLCSVDVPPLCLIQSHVIGVMQMNDCGKADEKIIAVAKSDVSVSHIRSLADIPQHFMSEMKRFFQDYTKLEGKEVIVDEFLGFDEAARIIQESVDRYKLKYPEMKN
jgi:inorganic pyrophosphatase